MRTPDHGPTRQTRSSEAWRAMTEPTNGHATTLRRITGQLLVSIINKQAARLSAQKQETTR